MYWKNPKAPITANKITQLDKTFTLVDLELIERTEISIRFRVTSMFQELWYKNGSEMISCSFFPFLVRQVSYGFDLSLDFC